jgi:RNA polymerase sigma-70 factor (family 1)
LDQEWLAQIQHGDPHAFRNVYERYAPKVQAFLYKTMPDASIREEIIQETFIKLWLYRSHIQIDKPLDNYIFTIAQNLLYTYLKKRSAELLYLEDLKMHASNQWNSTHSLSELQKLLHQSLNLLPLKCREIFCKSRLDGKSNSEIAEQLAISKKTVENQLTKALKILRKELRQHGYDPLSVLIMYSFL